MRRAVYLTVVGLVALGALIVTADGAQVYPVRWHPEQTEPQAATPTPPSLVLAEGGIQFPDGSVQSTAAQVILIGPALVPVTGQTTAYASGDDGDLERGVGWPNPRFTDNGNGTVTDNLTGLIWLKDANCFGRQDWSSALAAANGLFDGATNDPLGGDCGLTDGSQEGAWHLPNVRELRSLVHYGVHMPAVPNTAGTGKWAQGDPFLNVGAGGLYNYWLSTTDASSPTRRWMAGLGQGTLGSREPNDFFVWPVRGGSQPQPAEPASSQPSASAAAPSVVLAEGGLQLPDGSVQTTATQVIRVGPALIPVTGQTVCYDAAGVVIDCTTGIGPGQNGALQTGVRWPNPRFTDKGDGTVVDNLTGLIWLKDANCFGSQTWFDALASANGLFDGATNDPLGGDCGLTDGSQEGAWHLPNVRELQSLVHYGVSNPAVPNTAGTGKWRHGDPFVNVLSDGYWSSTTSVFFHLQGCYLAHLHKGIFDTTGYEDLPYRVWPVRGGH